MLTSTLKFKNGHVIELRPIDDVVSGQASRQLLEKKGISYNPVTSALHETAEFNAAATALVIVSWKDKDGADMLKSPHTLPDFEAPPVGEAEDHLLWYLKRHPGITSAVVSAARKLATERDKGFEVDAGN